MAWRSSGSTHEEMVDSLKRNGLITTDSIEKGFRNVDRKLFVPPESKDVAYSDQPLREGKIHISAPHIYCSALEALELEEDSSTSFLNIGSGTGYLSCIVAEILGPKSLNYGIEIFEDTVKHSRQSIENWRRLRKESDANAPFLHLDIIHGNVFQISSSEGESIVGFDRIYVGAAVSRKRLSKITKLLSPGGILVGPVDDELVKVIRITRSKSSCVSSQHNRNYDEDDITISSEFTQQVLSNVRFAPFVNTPSLETIIPARVWSPTTQQYYPESFKEATNQIWLCSKSKIIQPHPPPRKTEERINLAAMLPNVLWMEILSYTHRKWFDSEETEIAYTKERLIEEQKNAAKAHAARLAAERRCQVAEKERDIYQLLARRWQSRLNVVLQQQRQMYESGMHDNPRIATMSVSERVQDDDEQAALFGLDSMLTSELDEYERRSRIVSFDNNNSMNSSENDDEADQERMQDDDQEMSDSLEDQNDSDDDLNFHHDNSIIGQYSITDGDNDSVVMEDVEDT